VPVDIWLNKYAGRGRAKRITALFARRAHHQPRPARRGRCA
jgi:hypothetical protein